MTDNRKKCKNCYSFFEGNYCNNCGQKGDEKRFKLSNLAETFVHGFYHVRGGLFFTVKELFIRPGEVLRGYISGRRIVYFNPFTFLVLICLVVGFVFKWAKIANHVDENLLASEETIRFAAQHITYRALLTIPTYVLMCSIIYKSFRYNLAEYIILNTFLISQSMIIMVIWLILIALINPNNTFFEILFNSAWISSIIYQIIVFFRLFNSENIAIRWMKASIVAIAGFYLSFVLMNFLVKFIAIF